mgnify:CR=1 FL=1
MFSHSIDLKTLVTPVWWLKREALLFALLVSGALTGLVFFSSKYWENIQLLSILAGITFLIPVLSLLIWRWRYLTSGKGYRVAIAFEGIEISADNMAGAQRELDALAHDVGLVINVKWIPAELISSNSKSLEFQRKFKLYLCTLVNVSKKLSGDRDIEINLSVNTKFTRSLKADLIKSMESPVKGLAQSHQPATSYLEQRQYIAKSVYEIVLLIVSTRLINDESYINALKVLQTLEKCVRKRGLNDTDRPLPTIRRMVVDLALYCTNYDIGCGVNEGRFRRASELLEHIVRRYGEQFEDVYIRAARQAFVSGDIETAIQYSERLLRSADTQMQSFGKLNLAALNLLSGNFIESNKYYIEFFKTELRNKLDWNDLIRFADLCRRNGQQHAVYLQYLYRSVVNGVDVPVAIEVDYQHWITSHADTESLKWLPRKYGNKVKNNKSNSYPIGLLHIMPSKIP